MPITLERTRALLGPLEAVRPISSKKMFGGLGIYCSGVFFAVIDDDRLYFKSDLLTDPEYDRYEADQWVINGEPPSPMPYREVPKAILDDSLDLGKWVDAAVGVAQRKKKIKR